MYYDYPIFRCGHWSTERWFDLHKVTQLITGRGHCGTSEPKHLAMVQHDLSSPGIATSCLTLLEPQFPNELKSWVEIFKKISSPNT